MILLWVFPGVARGLCYLLQVCLYLLLVERLYVYFLEERVMWYEFSGLEWIFFSDGAYCFVGCLCFLDGVV